MHKYARVVSVRVHVRRTQARTHGLASRLSAEHVLFQELIVVPLPMLSAMVLSRTHGPDSSGSSVRHIAAHSYVQWSGVASEWVGRDLIHCVVLWNRRNKYVCHLFRFSGGADGECTEMTLIMLPVAPPARALFGVSPLGLKGRAGHKLTNTHVRVDRPALELGGKQVCRTALPDDTAAFKAVAGFCFSGTIGDGRCDSARDVCECWSLD